MFCRWRSEERLIEFEKYFREQWLDSVFNKWQIYHTPAGFAATNNTNECFNGDLKARITEYETVSITEAIKKICDSLIPLICLKRKEFSWQRTNIGDEMNAAAARIALNITNFVQINPQLVHYTNPLNHCLLLCAHAPL